MSKPADTSLEKHDLNEIDYGCGSLSSKFLKAAKVVLERCDKPMSVNEITNYALDQRVLTSEGKTPNATMRARLSQNLRKCGYGSVFLRIGPNRFALRQWGGRGLKEYVAPQFKKSIPNEALACVPASAGLYSERDFGFLTEFSPLVQYIANPQNIVYVNRPDAERRTDIRQLVAYVVLRTSDGHVLTYRRGLYSAAPEMLRGARCLGFGGHIQAQDAHSLFGHLDGGVRMASTREISEELGGATTLDFAIRGVINDYSSPEGMKHIALVLEGRLPSNYKHVSTIRERSINDVRLASPEEVWGQFHDFEFWSQLLIKAFWPGVRPRNISTIHPRKKNTYIDTLVLVGEIASGKTTLATALQEQLGFTVISTRKCVSELIGVPDFKFGMREQFQQRALDFINSPSGPQKLAIAISKEVERATTPVVIDGIRHTKTLNHLREHIPSASVFYIDTPRDKAYSNYRNSSQRSVSLEEFRTVRHHPVEEQVVRLRHDADMFLFNGGTENDLLQLFINWWE